MYVCQEDNARLMDSIGGYNRQLAELRQQLSEAGDRESRIADAAQLAEERAAERQSQ